MVLKQENVPFEEALNMTGFGKYNLMAFILCSSIIMSKSLEFFSMSFLVPSSSCELNTTSAEQGLMAAIPLFGVISTSYFWGYLADTQGRRKILFICMTTAYIAGSMAALAPNWMVLCFLKFCSSAAVAGGYAISLTHMSESTPIDKRSVLMLLTTSVFLCSNGLMAVISIPILPLTFLYYIPYLDINFNSWRLLDLVFAIPLIFSALGVYSCYESPKYLLSVGRDEEAMDVLRNIYALNTGKNRDTYLAKSVVLHEKNMSLSMGFWASVKIQSLPMFKVPLLKSTLLLWALMFLVFIGVQPFLMWLPSIVDAAMSSLDKDDSDTLTFCEMMRLSQSKNSTDQVDDCAMDQSGLLIVFGISFIVAGLNIATSGLSHYFGRKYVFIILQITGGVTAIFINLSTIWVLSAILLMIFVSDIINCGTMASFCVDSYPTNIRAMAVSLTFMLGRLSAIIGINLLKRLMDVNCELAFYIFGAFTICGGIVAFLLPSESKPK